jgi:Cft2 family RNA processing exonuclease
MKFLRYIEHGAMDYAHVFSSKEEETARRDRVINFGIIYILVSIIELVFFQHCDNERLFEMIDIGQSEKGVVAACYEHPIYLLSYVRCSINVRNSINIPFERCNCLF